MKHLLSIVTSSVILGGSVLSLHAQPLPNKAKVVDGRDVILLDASLSAREDLNAKYLMSLTPDRLLHHFRLTAGIETTARPLGGWENPGCGLRGHFVGHYLSALSTFVQRHHDAQAEAGLCTLVDGLAECQARFANGYLGAIPEHDFDTLERTYGNVWAPYYTLHKLLQGLVDAYVKTGNEKALRVASKAADWVSARLGKLSPETLEGMFLTRNANPSNEHGGMNEVLEQLYSITRNERYLQTAKLFDRDWFVRPLVEHRDSLSGLHANTHIVLINGFVRRYENTGEERFRKAAINFWDMLTAGHTYANGTSSGPRPVVTTPTSRTAEHWGDSCMLSNTLSGEIAESCVTHNTQKLNRYLFQWTADARYADASMNTFYNATLACQNKLDGRVTYHLPLGSPRHKAWLGTEDFRCCNGSGIEAFASLNSDIYYVGDRQLYVTRYIASKMRWAAEGVSVTQSTGYPFAPETTLTVNGRGRHRFALNLLVPSWAREVELTINGKQARQQAQPGSFLTIRRKWSDGDAVKLAFKLPFHVKTMPDNADKLVICHGPLMLAFLGSGEVALPESADELLGAISGSPAEGYVLRSAAGTFRLKPLCDIVDEDYSCYIMTGVKHPAKP